MPEKGKRVALAPETLEAFQVYVQEAELAMAPCFLGTADSLSPDLTPELIERVLKGHVSADPSRGSGASHVVSGLIHDWTGAVFVEGGTAEEALAVLQDYNRHKEIYRPDVMDSRLLERDGNDFKVLLRLRKKKVVTVVLDTWHDVHYAEVCAGRWTCRSLTTCIREVEDAGTPKEASSENDSGYGYMWRLNSYWYIRERDGGVWLECRAISLSRDVPKGLGWVIEPIVAKLPRESLTRTLEATRDAIKQQSKEALRLRESANQSGTEPEKGVGL